MVLKFERVTTQGLSSLLAFFVSKENEFSLNGIISEKVLPILRQKMVSFREDSWQYGIEVCGKWLYNSSGWPPFSPVCRLIHAEKDARKHPDTDLCYKVEIFVFECLDIIYKKELICMFPTGSVYIEKIRELALR